MNQLERLEQIIREQQIKIDELQFLQDHIIEEHYVLPKSFRGCLGTPPCNLRLIFNKQTNKLITAEVIL